MTDYKAEEKHCTQVASEYLRVRFVGEHGKALRSLALRFSSERDAVRSECQAEMKAVLLKYGDLLRENKIVQDHLVRLDRVARDAVDCVDEEEKRDSLRAALK